MTFPVRLITLLAVTVGWFLSAPAAFFGPSWIQHQSVFTPVMVFIVVLGPVWWRDRAYLRLPTPQRRRVDTAVNEGVPTGDAGLDDIAADRLARAARSARSDRVARPIFAAAFVVVPVVAAIRVSPWFLLTLVPAAWVGLRMAREARRGDPRMRWARWAQLTPSATTTATQTST